VVTGIFPFPGIAVFMRKSSRGGAYGGETGEAKLVAKARDLREGVGVPWLEGEKLHV
jgi:hypothetical protein